MNKIIVCLLLLTFLAACQQVPKGGTPLAPNPSLIATQTITPFTPSKTSTPTSSKTPMPAPAEIQAMKTQLTNLGINATISQDTNSNWHVSVMINNQPVEITSLTSSVNYDIFYASTNQGLFFFNQETKAFQQITNPNETVSLPEALQQAWNEYNTIQSQITQSVYEGNVWGTLPEGVTEADWSQKQQALFNESLSLWKSFLLTKGQITDKNIDSLNLLQAVFKYVRENDQTKETNLPLWIVNYLLTQQKVENIAWWNPNHVSGLALDGGRSDDDIEIFVKNRVMNFDGQGGFNMSEWQNMVINKVMTKGIIRPPPAVDHGQLEAIIPITGAKENSFLIIIGHNQEGKPPYFEAQIFHLDSVNIENNNEVILPSYFYDLGPLSSQVEEFPPPIITLKDLNRIKGYIHSSTLTFKTQPYFNIRTLDDLLNALGQSVRVQGDLDVNGSSIHLGIQGGIPILQPAFPTPTPVVPTPTP